MANLTGSDDERRVNFLWRCMVMWSREAREAQEVGDNLYWQIYPTGGAPPQYGTHLLAMRLRRLYELLTGDRAKWGGKDTWKRPGGHASAKFMAAGLRFALPRIEDKEINSTLETLQKKRAARIKGR